MCVCRDPIQDPNKPQKYQYLLDFCSGRKCDNDNGVGGGTGAVVSFSGVVEVEAIWNTGYMGLYGIEAIWGYME